MFKTYQEKFFAVYRTIALFEHSFACLMTWYFILNSLQLVSQFTLLASTKKGSKPDFHGAAPPTQAKALYEYFLAKVQEGHQHGAEKVKDGVFQAMMEVALVNDGPVSSESQSLKVLVLLFNRLLLK